MTDPIPHPESAPEAVPALEELAAEYTRRLRDGQRPSLEEYCDRYPELADEIRDVLPVLAMLEDVGDEQHEPEPDTEGMPRQIGEYSILREVGRGGMGVVYEAMHESLRRRVALKVLLVAPGNDESRTMRFLREARSAGRLHHTNIVPVFEIGSVGTWHYYSMQFIEGQNLDAVIDELRAMESGEETTLEMPGRPGSGDVAGATTRDMPADSGSSEGSVFAAQSGPGSGGRSDTSSVSAPTRGAFFNRVAEIGLQIADALEHAHAHRILHRDIKPSNLILDTDGSVWITDFGLAKHETDDLTHTGDIVGTLRYMAPERFSGQGDARSDLFSLGLTLYELCTLQPAYRQSHRGDLIDAIKSGSPAPPRRVNPAVPQDLETVILKLTERDPNHRYSSAEELAVDLRLFLDDRPVLARRATVFERAIRWCRRNPMPASLLVSVFVLLAVLSAGSIAVAVSMSEYAAQQRQDAIVKSAQSDELRKRTQAAEIAEKEALKAEQEAQRLRIDQTRKHFMAQYLRAQALRFSGRPGQHFAALDALGVAEQLLPDLEFEEVFVDVHRRLLRDEAMASLPLTDIRINRMPRAPEEWDAIQLWSSGFEAQAQVNAEGAIRILRSDEVVHEIPATRPVQHLRFSPDGRYLAATIAATPDEKRRLTVWSVPDGELRVSVELHASSGVAADLGNELLAVGHGDGTGVQIISLTTGQAVASTSRPDPVRALGFSPTGEELAILAGETVSVWKHAVDESTEIECDEDVTAVAWSPSKLVVGDHSGVIRIFAQDALTEPPQLLTGHSSRVTVLYVSDEAGLVASAAWDGTARMWDAAAGAQILRLEDQPFCAPGFSADGGHIAISERGRTVRGDITHNLARHVLQNVGREGRVWDVRWHPDSIHLFVATEDGIEIWHTQTDQLLAQYDVGVIRSACLAADSEAVLTSGDNGVQRWPIEVGEQGLRLGDPDVVLPGACKRMSVDALVTRAVVERPDRTAWMISLDGPVDPVQVAKHAALDRVILTPDAKWVVTSTWGGTGIRVWDVEKQQEIADVAPKSGNAVTAVTPDNKLLIGSMASRRQAAWKVGDWQHVRDLQARNAQAWPGAVGVSPESRYLAITNTRFSARLLSLPSMETVCLLPASDQPESLEALEFDSTGHRLAIGLRQKVEVWDLDVARRRLAEIGLDWKD